MRALAAGLLAAAVLLAGAPGAAAEAGVDEPQVFSQQDLTTEPVEGPTSTTSNAGNASIVVQDRRVIADSSVLTTQALRAGGTATAKLTMHAELPVCPDDTGTIEGTVRIDLVVTNTDGSSRRVEVTSRLVGFVDDETQLSSFDLPGIAASAEVARAGEVARLAVAGQASGLTLRSDNDGDFDGSIVENEGEHGIEPSNLLLLAVTYARDYSAEALRVAVQAATNGLCIDLQVDTRGVRILGAGASTPIDATVFDAITGEELDLPVEPIPADGTTNPDTKRPAPVTFTYTAPGEQRPTYTVYFQVRSRRGGDDVEVVFGQGWAFSGVILAQQSGAFTGVSTWSGFVCGDPFDSPWTFTQIVEVDSVREENTFDTVPVGLGGPRPEVGTVPMLQRVDAAPGQPPFLLFLDDVAPEEVTPATQRIQVEVRPATTECAP